ncbi:GGDEF domain-containing protein [Hyphomicrobiales bacterium]|nr:GGDEF domain-containing protein [Hyphomicrobiales bacterium]CAH1664272.1 GGDEF domain-containing protein [Hyphomicrobiales bacterium]
MSSAPPLDAATLFAVNATSLVVFAIAYLIAWSRRSNRTYWLNLTIANIIFAIAFVMFSRRVGGGNDALLLPNCLIMVGLGFRWQAIRAFFGHRPRYLLSIILTALVAGLLSMVDQLGIALVFGSANIAIAIQIFVIMFALARERNQHLPSRWGLVFAYGVVAASSVLRVIQGWMLDRGMDSLLPADTFLDIHLLAAAVHIVASGAFSLSMAYEQGTSELQQAALRDPLTGLSNRLGLENALAQQSGSFTQPYSVMVIDIDDFKRINDIHGHNFGDAVIKRCGETIAKSLRANDLVARFGGEEFVAVLPQVSLDQARILCERVRAAIEREVVRGDDVAVQFTVSIGLSQFTAHPRSFSELIVDADKQLYRAKAAGKNRVEAAQDVKLDVVAPS